MGNCPNCGHKLSNIDVLCPKCGSVVEVVQVKGSDQTANQAKPVDSAVNIAAKNEKKDFIVYNEDMPFDNSAGGDITSDDNAGANMPSDYSAGEDTPSDDYLGEEYLDAGKPEEKPSPVDDSKKTSIFDIAWPDIPGDVIVEDGIPDTAQPVSPMNDLSDTGTADDSGNADYEEEYTASDDKTSESEDQEAYSQRYLEKIKSISLPEIDDLNDFDPEEFMREYKLGKNSPGDIPVTEPGDEKKWLEIEEASDSFESENRKSDELPFNDAPESTGRRYRYNPEAASPPRETVKLPKTKNKDRKKHSVLIAVVLWAVIAGALLGSFVFFDSYVKKAYGGYGSFIYTITNGNIDPGNMDTIN